MQVRAFERYIPLIEKVDIVADYVADKLDAPLSEVETQLWKFFHRFIITGK